MREIEGQLPLSLYERCDVVTSGKEHKNQPNSHIRQGKKPCQDDSIHDTADPSSLPRAKRPHCRCGGGESSHKIKGV